MSNHKKIWLVVVSVLVLCSVIAIVTPFAAMLYGVTSEAKTVKDRLNNPYINSNLKNWQEVTIEEINLSFRIPPDWSIHEASGTYTLEDESGKSVATGIICRTGHNSQAEETDWYQSLVEFSVEDVEWTEVDSYTSFTAIASFGQLTIRGIEQANFYELAFPMGTEYLRMAFPADQGLSEQEICEYAEAMIYSYCFS